MVFGVNSCPFQAQFVTRKHAEENSEKLPAAADAVLNSTYMDDTLASVTDSPAGVELSKQLQEMWTTAGIHARKWLSNSREVMQTIPEEDRAEEINLEDSELPSVKTFAGVWKTAEDVFTFIYALSETLAKHTKRTFLSRIASLFDPNALD